MSYYKCKTDGVGGGSVDGPRYITKINGKIQNKDIEFKVKDMNWISVSTLPYKFRNSSAVVYNNEIHILGTQETDCTIKHYKYDGSKWTNVSTLPYKFYLGSAVIYNNEIHILGGYNNTTKHYKYDGSTWTSVSTLPYEFRNSPAVVYNNEIHILGGVNNDDNHYKTNTTYIM